MKKSILIFGIGLVSVFLSFQSVNAAGSCYANGVRWNPSPSPWSTSPMNRTFAVTQNYTIDSPGTPGGNVETWQSSCTTVGAKNGETCSAQCLEVAKYDHDCPAFDLRITSCKSPENRIDGLAPICGTWSGGPNFALSGSYDAPADAINGSSGIDLAHSQTTCTAQPGGKCSVTIYDNAANATTCESPTYVVGQQVCSIDKFSFSPGSINQGSSTLASWTSTGVAGNLDYSCSGDLGSGTLPANGQQTVFPRTTPSQTCTLTGKSSSGVACSKSATVNVLTKSTLPTCSIDAFSFNPNPITKGQITNASWSSTGVSGNISWNCDGDLGSGTGLAPNGQMSVSPAVKQTCILSAQSSANQTCERSATINVNSAAVYYACSGNSCVQSNSGSYTSPNCNNACSAPPVSAGTISVTSNIPANWMLAGPGVTLTEWGQSTSQTYTDQPAGIYSMNQEVKAGYTSIVTPASSQTLLGGGSVSFVITYTPISGGSYRCTLAGTCILSSQGTYGSKSACAKVCEPAPTYSCDSNLGSCVQDPNGINYSKGMCDLYCSLQQPRCTGGLPANSSYCQGDTSGLPADTATTLVSSCGAPKCEATCNSGYVKSGGACVAASQTHLECVSNSCASVAGAGANRCGNNADCGSGAGGGGGGGGGGGPAHGICDPASFSCVNVSGAGGSTCSSDPGCGGSGVSHLECQNNSCVIVGGAGTNQCTAIGPGCAAPSFCSMTATPKIISKGGSATLTWTCDAGVNGCVLYDTTSGAKVSLGSVPTNCRLASSCGAVQKVKPAKTGKYILECLKGGVKTSANVGVTVTSIIECNPNDPTCKTN